MQMDIDAYSEATYRIPFEQTEKWSAYLADHGFVVLANYLPKDSCEKYVDQFWAIMEVLSEGKMSKNDIQSHSNNDLYPPVLHGGMIQYVGHSKTQWEIRQTCKPIFQRIWKSENVKSSFDGFCFMNGARKYEKRLNNAFLHCDQSPLKNYVWSYQGIMTLTDSKEGQGGFVCVPKSHLFHYTYFENKGLLGHKNDWYKVPEEEKIKEPLCYDIKLDTEAGDFILFDSRTFHCNTVPTKNCLRVCTYVCMLPTQVIAPRFLQARVEALNKRRTTSHHPGDGFRTFVELPKQTKDPIKFKQVVQKINSFQLAEEMKSLV